MTLVRGEVAMTKQSNRATNLAVRAHDIVVCMERARPSEFEAVPHLGAAVRLALHLRGAPPMDYALLKDVAVHILSLNPAEFKPVLLTLAEAEFVSLETEGKTIKLVVPNVPYFDDLYSTLTTVTETSTPLTEMEQVTMELLERLSHSPMARESAFAVGAEATAVNRTIEIGVEGGFLVSKRTRGRTILVSPSYFPENPQAFADLVAKSGASSVGRVLDLLRANQGYPLRLIEETKDLAGHRLSPDDIAIMKALAGEGFTAPPAIQTRHAGTNFFMFGPRPGNARLPPYKRGIYERALALVSAVRQGQLLPDKYRIRSPKAILLSLKRSGWLRANSEAWEQYRQVATMGIARLVPHGYGHRLELVTHEDGPDENMEALDMAIDLVDGGTTQTVVDDNAVLAFREGHAYVESLIGRKRLIDQPVVAMNEDTKAEMEAFILTSVK